uniref:Uncharacterized protein n=1 Tax=Rhodococcus erythropolis TaxID=1833 RepID=Q6XMT9_RHOER|nr:hypothetical protein PBD2.207 [Rhodococcus erythropolis]
MPVRDLGTGLQPAGAVLIPRVRALRRPGEVDGPAARRRVLARQQRNAGHHGVEGEVRQRHRLRHLDTQPVFDHTSRHGSVLLHRSGSLGRGRCRCDGPDSDRLRGMPQPGSVRIGHALHPTFLPEAQVHMRIAHPPRDRRIFRLAFRVARDARPARRPSRYPRSSSSSIDHSLGRLVIARIGEIRMSSDWRSPPAASQRSGSTSNWKSPCSREAVQDRDLAPQVMRSGGVRPQSGSGEYRAP